MDFELTADERAFRKEVRDWIEANLAPEWRTTTVSGAAPEADPAVQKQWQQRLFRDGWLKLTWPEAEGGRGAGPMLKAIYDEEMALAGAPMVLGRTGVSLLVPMLRRFGSDWQKAMYIDAVLAGDMVFCQGFSEPNAGSDLSSLQSRAEFRDGRWVLNGQKVWSSNAHLADHCFFLARTEKIDPARPHKNIGYFLLDLRQPGIEVREIKQMTGESEFCEIFVTDGVVEERDRVPADGWQIAMATFGIERGIHPLHTPARFKGAAGKLAALLRERGLAADPVHRQHAAQSYIEARIFDLMMLRLLTELEKTGEPGPASSVSKLMWSGLDKRLQESAIAAQGLYGALEGNSPWAIEAGRWQYAWMFSFAQTIYGGTSEIQHNLVAERVLGLPRGR